MEKARTKDLIANKLEDDNDQTLISTEAGDKFTQMRKGISLSISSISRSVIHDLTEYLKPLS